MQGVLFLDMRINGTCLIERNVPFKPGKRGRTFTFDNKYSLFDSFLSNVFCMSLKVSSVWLLQVYTDGGVTLLRETTPSSLTASRFKYNT